ncbi:hypothetical protein Ciccas_006353 [Cichlidogyrus casuarinus]|uniref:EF-hand domain-containing protein n=1 Tax=Cichlidogyrus casuarinus TaxID=1844966 RepID=A0ABD2Q620_9PLAT
MSKRQKKVYFKESWPPLGVDQELMDGLHEMFDMLDKNGEGYIPLESAKTSLHLMGLRSISNYRLKEMARHFETRDGVPMIDFVDYCSIMIMRLMKKETNFDLCQIFESISKGSETIQLQHLRAVADSLNFSKHCQVWFIEFNH